MADIPTYGILHQLGFDPLLLTAGFLGGLLRAFLLRSARPLDIVAAISAGFIVGNYLGSTVALALKPIFAEGAAMGAGGLIAGFTAMTIMQLISRLLVKKFENGNGNAA